MNCLIMILSCPHFSSLCLNFLTPPFLSVMWASRIWLLTSYNTSRNLSSSFSPLAAVFFSLSFLPTLLTLSLFTFTPQTLLHHTVTPTFYHCSLLSPSSDVRLRVRAEYLEHESALRDGVSSDKQQPLERQFELFSQANTLLRSRDLGSIVCDIKFTELENLDAFWSDYLSGALLEALKGVFITDSLRMAAGSEGVRLLISVDQDDYEEGRMLLKANSGSSGRLLSSSNGGRTGTHWAI